MDFMRGSRNDQSTSEWNSSGAYASTPIVYTTRVPSRRTSLWPLALATLTASLGLSAGLLLRGPAPAPAPVVVAAAPAPAPALPVAPAAVEQPAPLPARSTSAKASRCLAMGWDFYSVGAYDRASDMAMEALEAVGRERGTAAQRAQARGLLDASQEKLHRRLPEVVQVNVPEPAPPVVPQVVPAVYTPPQTAQQAPAALPQPNYPQASARPAPRPLARYEAPVPAPVAPSVGHTPFQRVEGPQVPGLGPIPYPQGRGPGVCPNYFVQDDCACHQFEDAFRQQQQLARMQPQAPPRFGTRQPTSRIEQMRRNESFLYRGI